MELAMDRKILRGAYGRLRAINYIVQAEQSYVMSQTVGHDFNNIVKQLGKETAEDFSDFVLPDQAFVDDEGIPYLSKREIQNKIEQIIQYLEYVFHLNEQILEIGSLYNSIQD
jgi:hypothetical protein